MPSARLRAWRDESAVAAEEDGGDDEEEANVEAKDGTASATTERIARDNRSLRRP